MDFKHFNKETYLNQISKKKKEYEKSSQEITGTISWIGAGIRFDKRKHIIVEQKANIFQWIRKPIN